MKALIFFAPGLEECEGLVTVDLLRRAGVEVLIAAVSDEIMITGAHGITIRCDALASEVSTEMYDAVILPGGMPGTENLYQSELVRHTAKWFSVEGRLVAAICAAPTVLGRIGILEGRRATCYPGCEDQLIGAEIVRAEAVQDQNIITGAGLGAAIPFALAVIAALEGNETAERVKASIVYQH